jgi:GT2 family glycosyltransferase
MTKVSVITLTKDRPEWLDEAIQSIEAQTDQRYEHLVHDNASVRCDVEDVLSAAHARRPKRFFYSTAKETVDLVGVHWNTLLDLVKGQYVTILDDDNRKKPDFVEKMIAPMETDPMIDAVSCGWSVMDENGKLTGEERHWNLTTSVIRLWETNTIDSNALMFRATVPLKIGKFDPELTTNEDWDFVIRLVRNCKMVHLEESLLDYRVHAGARSKRALALGAYDNWDRIREKHFTTEERKTGMRAAVMQHWT